MLYNFQRKNLCRHLFVGGALCAAVLGTYSCSDDKYDLDTEQPSGLNSIYGYLSDQGNYTNCLRLIDDLGQTEILSQTGSKTIFVADDDAFNAFYASNKWGVRSYEQLSLAQKKLLLNSSMIDNPYTTSMLSTATGPLRGEVLRRASSTALYDSVLVVPSNSALADKVLPHNARFDQIRASHDNIVLFTDASTAAPMLHFTPKFLTSNKIQSSDIDFIYNQPAGTRQSDDVYINDAKIIENNIFCKNGFVQKVDRVIMPLDNMAEIIRQKPNMSLYNSIVERFAAPDFTRALTDAYNQNKGTAYDSVFNKRFFSDRSSESGISTSVSYSLDKNDKPMEGNASLKFDPGWNGYITQYVVGDNTGREGMMEDMAVMIVPSDDAFNNWWNNGGGKVIKDFYHTLPATPSSVLDDLVRVNQLASFIQSVPTRFGEILNDANQPLGITTADVDSVFLACNGAIYMTNKVFAPTSYSSVLFPAVIDTINFTVVENSLKNLQYDTYLNSMVSKYILLLPTKDGMLQYIDPCSYGRTDGSTNAQLWEFHLDPAQTAPKMMYADVFNCILSDGQWVKTGSRITQIKGGTGARDVNGNKTTGDTKGVLQDRFEDLLDNIVVIEPYQAGKKYYRTKGNSFVRIDGIAETSNVYGSLQQAYSNPLPVKQSYNMENGTTLVLDGIAQGTDRSVAKVLSEHSEFSDFLSILDASGAISKINNKNSWLAGDQTLGNLYNQKNGGEVGAEDTDGSLKKATYLLNNFHYTIYAPTNAAMATAFAMGLPDLTDLANAEAWDAAFATATNGMTDAEVAEYMETNACSCKGDSTARIKEAMLDFVKYHIQDNAIFLDAGFQTGKYKTGKTALIKSTSVDEETGAVSWNGKYSPGRPYEIAVQSVSPTSMTIVDNVGTTHNIDTSSGLYNLMAREYWYAGTTNSKPYEIKLENSSFAVIHAISEPLIYADGNHTDSQGNIVESQFVYKYKPLTTE